MYKKTMTYIDCNGIERTEDFWFNLTKAELVKMQMGTTGGLDEMMKKLVSTKDIPAIINIFEDLVLKAYGEKSADGRRFMKTPEITAAFSQTQAYSDLFMELAFDAKAAAEFINGIVPADVSKQMSEQAEGQLLESLA